MLIHETKITIKTKIIVYLKMTKSVQVAIKSNINANKYNKYFNGILFANLCDDKATRISKTEILT